MLFLFWSWHKGAILHLGSKLNGKKIVFKELSETDYKFDFGSKIVSFSFVTVGAVHPVDERFSSMNKERSKKSLIILMFSFFT